MASDAAAAATGSSSGSGSDSGGTGQVSSPGTFKASRLVANSLVRGQLRRTASARRAVSSRRCSQLSRTTSACRPCRCSTSRRRPPSEASPSMPSTTMPRLATAREITWAPSVSGARSTKNAPSGKVSDCFGGHFPGQPRLSRSPRPDERHQVGLPQEPGDLVELALSAHERTRDDGQVVALAPRCSQGRKGSRQLRVDHLEDPFGAAQIPQPVLAQIKKPDPAPRFLGSEGPARLRDKHLTTVGEIEQAGEAVQGRAEEVSFSFVGRPDVDGHADGERASRAPPFRQQTALPGHGGAKGSRRCGEGGADPISGVLEHSATVILDRRSQQMVVTDKGGGHVVLVVLPPPGTGRDVGEQEDGHLRPAPHPESRMSPATRDPGAGWPSRAGRAGTLGSMPSSSTRI